MGTEGVDEGMGGCWNLGGLDGQKGVVEKWGSQDEGSQWTLKTGRRRRSLNKNKDEGVRLETLHEGWVCLDGGCDTSVFKRTQLGIWAF